MKLQCELIAHSCVAFAHIEAYVVLQLADAHWAQLPELRDGLVVAVRTVHEAGVVDAVPNAERVA